MQFSTTVSAQRLGRATRTALILLLALLVGSPLAAYTIYLKDGSRIIAREKYTIEGDKAVIVLQSGTRSFIAADQIDVPRTEEANQTTLGSAVVIEGREKRELAQDERLQAEPPRERGLGDFIRERHSPEEGQYQLPEPRQPVGGRDDAPRSSRGGWLDLTTVRRQPYGTTEIADELDTFLRGQGLQKFEILQGSRPERPLLRVTTAYEEDVLTALIHSASALLEVRDRFGDSVEALEVLMLKETEEKGGQFVLTPELAQQLISRRIEPHRFFVQHVQF